MGRYSFLVRLLHPLLHAGLARRTVMAILRQPGSEFPSGPMCVELVFLLVGVTSALTTVKGMAFEDYPCFVAE